MVFHLNSYFSDQLRLLARLNPDRMINYLKMRASLGLSRIISRPVVWSQPFSVHLETASVCNLKCPECIAGMGLTSRNSKLMDVALVREKLKLHQKHAFYCNLYFQGEPFLNPNLAEIINQATGLNYYSVVSTNGHFLDEKNCIRIIESGLDKLIVSLDGIDSESYSKYRSGGLFNKVTRGIRQMAETKKSLNKKNPLLVVQMLVNKNNEHQLGKARQFVKDMGADMLEFKSMQIYTDDGKKQFLPSGKKFNRYFGKSRNFSPQSHKKGVCTRLWSHVVYTSDGFMVPCCYDKKPEYLIKGDNGVNSNLWRSEKMQEFRAKLFRKEEVPEICRNCGS
ncbi:MAG: radical SAM protein [Bacteroidales bacterium]|nr:radical SAM protein [Bacteroidales bacterium]